MIFNSVISIAGGSTEWKPLPSSAVTRAPTYGYYNFSITFDSIPDGVLIKGEDKSSNSASECCGYMFGLDNPKMSGPALSIIEENIDGNTFSGTLRYGDITATKFYYKEIV